MKTALYKLSGHIGARTPEVSSKRKPLKAARFDVAGSNRGSSLCPCSKAQSNFVCKKVPKPVCSWSFISHKVLILFCNVQG